MGQPALGLLGELDAQARVIYTQGKACQSLLLLLLPSLPPPLLKLVCGRFGIGFLEHGPRWPRTASDISMSPWGSTHELRLSAVLPPGAVIPASGDFRAGRLHASRVPDNEGSNCAFFGCARLARQADR